MSSATAWRVVYDAQALQTAASKDRGIGRYVRGHVTALNGIGAVDRLVGNPYAPFPDRDGLPPALPMEENRPGLLGRIAGEGPVIYLVGSPFETGPAEAVVTPHGVGRADAVVVVLYDLIPYRFPEVYQADRANRAFFRRRAHLVTSADLVLTISERTRTDAIELLGLDRRRVVTIGSAASEFFRPPEPNDALVDLRRELPAVNRPFVLTVSGYEPRKDATLLISAFAELPPALRDAHQLVIVCDLPPGAERTWRAHAERVGLAPDRLVPTGHVPDDVMRALYQRCALFVYSSRYEGFGLPVLEAARCGAPAITSDSSALPEVLDCPDSTFPTGDVTALGAAIARGLTDESHRDELRAASQRAAARHTWGAVADRTVAAFQRLDPPHAPAVRRAPVRHRTAVCTPLPPSKSGVAVFTGLVVPELAARHDVDCFRDGPPAVAIDRDRPYRCFSASAFRSVFSPGSYDSVLYVMGNSYFHRYTLGHAIASPGVVWLHDASLVGCYLTVAGMYLPDRDPFGVDREAARATMREALVRCNGPAAPDMGNEWADPDAYARAGLTMTEEVLRTARAVIVSTNLAAATVRAVAPDVPVHVVPLPVPSRRAGRGAPGEHEPLVVSLGWVDPIKRPLDLLEAFARVNRTIPSRLAFVGECAPFLSDEIRAHAARLGVSDRVDVTGFVEQQTAYDEWLSRATCVVQLRRRSHGESSGALMDAIACGVPIITSVASAREFPDGVADVVEPDASIDVIAARIERLLGDADLQRAMIDAGSQHAAAWSAADVAAAVAEVLVSTAPV